MKKTTILVTGCTGFLGAHLISELIKNPKLKVIGTCRKPYRTTCKQDFETRKLDLLDTSTLDHLFDDIDVVIHTAGLAHDVRSRASHLKSDYLKINTAATIDLATYAMQGSVSHFIFISSIKVNGDQTTSGEPFVHNSLANPNGIYALSKFRAENELKRIANNTKMAVTIIRPSLIYGPNLKGNLATMERLIRRRIPLPIGSINSNRRGLISVSNLTSLITECVFNPKAKNNVFLASDDKNRSTREIAYLVAKQIGIKPILIKMPIFLIKFFATILGKKDFTSKLTNSMEVDNSETKRILSWQPPFP